MQNLNLTQTIGELTSVGIKLRANYNGLLTELYSAKSDEAREIITEVLSNIEDTLISNGYRYSVKCDKKGKILRIVEVFYSPSKTGLGRGLQTFSKTKYPKGRGIDKSEVIKRKNDYPNAKGDFLYISPSEFEEFKKLSMKGVNPYVGAEGDFSGNRYYANFREKSFVAIVISDNGHHLRVRAKSSFLKYRGYEDYILDSSNLLRRNLKNDLQDHNYVDHAHKGRARYLDNLRSYNIEDFYNLNVYSDVHKFNEYISEFNHKLRG